MADSVEENPVAEKEKKRTSKGLWAPTRGYFQIQAKPGAGAPRAAPRAAATAEKKSAASAPKKGEPAPAGAEGPALSAKAAGEAAPKKEAAAAPAARAAPAVKEAVKAPAKPAAKPGAAAPKKDPLRESVTAVPKLAESAATRAIAQALYDEPDSETTLYRVPSLNVLFAVSSALLLLFTVLVVWQDYDRPWKSVQADWNEALGEQYEQDLSKARESQTAQLTALVPKLEEMARKLAAGDAAAALIAKAAAAAEKRGLPARVDALVEGVKTALAKSAKYEELKKAARAAQIKFTLLEKDLRARKGEFQAEKFKYEERKREALEKYGDTGEGAAAVRAIEAEFNRIFVTELNALDAEVETRKVEAEAAEKALAKFVEAETMLPDERLEGPAGAATAVASPDGAKDKEAGLQKIESELQRIVREVTSARKKVESVEKDWRTAIRSAPLLDAFAPVYKIDKVVVDDLHEDLNFLTVPRVDRCKTCHININSTDPKFVSFRSRKWGSVYASHPRLDLFVGDSSPHPYDSFGCTTCHYGDGHSTDFITAAHTPGDEKQAKEWEKKYGWERLHHQDYPMLKKSYITASCMKCHPGDHKLDGGGQSNLGYEVIKTYGCFGCHRIKTFEGFEKVGPSLSNIGDKVDIKFLYQWIKNPPGFRPSTRMPRFFDLTNSKGTMLVVGPDGQTHELDFELRNKVEVFSIATYLSETSGHQKELHRLGAQGDPARGRDLFRLNCTACHSVKRESMVEGIPEDADALCGKALEALEKFRSPIGEAERGAKPEEAAKLAALAAKADQVKGALEALRGWLDNLSVGKNIEELYHNVVAPADDLGKLSESLGMADAPVPAVKAAASSVQSRWIHNSFAPDLSSIGSKVKSADWLADWILDPRQHDPKTIMPRFRLEKDADGEQKVADLVAYLMTLRDPAFEAREGFSVASPEEVRVLDEIVFDYKRRDMTRAEAKADMEKLSTSEKLKYAGLRLIRRYGCFGCHLGIKDTDSKAKEKLEDGTEVTVAGTFDKAQPIGTELNGWGIKGVDRLDYGNWGHQLNGREAIDHTRYDWAKAKLTDPRRFDVIPAEKEGEEGKYHYVATNRLVQKTPEELLKMPLFAFASDEGQVEAVITFLLALGKDRIPLEKMRQHTEEQRALEEGSRLIAKLNCRGCHRIGAEPQFVHVSSLPRFSLSFAYDSSDESKRRDEVEKETWLSRELKLEARLVPPEGKDGGKEGKELEKRAFFVPRGALLKRKVFDDDSPLSVVELAAGIVDPDSGTRIQGHFELNQMAEESRVLPVGGYEEGRIRFYFGEGADQRPQAPPPLVRQGERVRGDWLFHFLRDVKPIRPWLKVRMPSFYLTDDEARTIVRWFKVSAGVPVTSESFPEESEKGLASMGRSLFDKAQLGCNNCHPAGEKLPTEPVLTPEKKFDWHGFRTLIPDDSYYVVIKDQNGQLRLQAGFNARAAAEAWARENLQGAAFAVGDPWSKLKWGPDLSLAVERLRPAWIFDWLSEPQDFMPGTSMPNFFGERKGWTGINLTPENREKFKALVQFLVHMKSLEGVASSEASGGIFPPDRPGKSPPGPGQ
jgi:cytochrome c2